MIKNYGQIQATLRGMNAEGWAKSLDIGNVNKIKVSDLPQPDYLKGENQKGFGEVLFDTINQVNEMQKSADQKIMDLTTGKTKNLHETLLAVEKAEIAFKTANQIRLKVIDAYKEMMKIQV